MSKKKTEHVLFDRDRIPKRTIHFGKANRSDKPRRKKRHAPHEIYIQGEKHHDR